METKVEWNNVGRLWQYGNLIVENVPDELVVQRFWHGHGSYPWAEIIKQTNGTYAMRVCVKRLKEPMETTNE